MEIKSRTANGVVIMELSGNIEPEGGGEACLVDFAGMGVDTVGDAVDSTIAGGKPKVLIDLQHVRFIDSSALGALIMYKKRAMGAGGELKLLRPQGRVKRVIEMVRLDQIFDIHDDDQAALASFE